MDRQGIYTSEFWLTVIKSGIGLLIATGKIQPGDAKTLEGATTNIVASVFALLASAHVVSTYIRSRATVKAVQH